MKSPTGTGEVVGRRVVITGPVGAAGLDLLREKGLEVVQTPPGDRPALLEALAGAEALVVADGVQVDAEVLAAAPHLRVVGTVGDAAETVDLGLATERGVLVVNAPTGNAVSAVEHTFALLFALARHVPKADAWLRRGAGDGGPFTGLELRGKVLGVVGLGQVGQGVAASARAFGLEVLAHDPYLSREAARRRNLDLVALDELLERSDVVSLHLPGTESERGLLGKRELGRMRAGALLVDLSRRGVVDQEALLAALDSGRLGGAALDVVAASSPEVERLLHHPAVVATPGLEGQTVEALERTAREVVQGVVGALGGSLAAGAVNLPFPSTAPGSLPFLRLGEQLGRLTAALVGGPFQRLTVTLEGVEASLHRPISLAAARGTLARVLGERVTFVNVEQHAERRGLELVTRERRGGDGRPGQVQVTLEGEGGDLTVAGTVFEDGEPRVMQLGRLPLEFRPYGRLLILRTGDVPGVVGRVGTLLGESGVNIADVHLARKDGETEAWTVLRLDEPAGPEVLGRLQAMPEMRVALTVDLDPGAPVGAAWDDAAAPAGDEPQG